MAPSDALERVLVAAEAVLSGREDQMLTCVEWDALIDAVRYARGMTTYTHPNLMASLAVQGGGRVSLRLVTLATRYF